MSNPRTRIGFLAAAVAVVLVTHGVTNGAESGAGAAGDEPGSQIAPTPDAISGGSDPIAAGCPVPAFVPPEPGVPFALRAHDGYVDPAKESDNGVDVQFGLTTLAIEFNTPMENMDGTPLSVDAFTLTDTVGAAPDIVAVGTDDSRTVQLVFSDHITLLVWTTVTVQARSQCDQTPFVGTLDIGYLPGDINQDGIVTPLDVLRFKQFKNGVATPPNGVLGDFLDINREGIVNPLDLLRFKQMVNGISPPSTRAWAGESLPDRP